jgi:hypothetical protein
LNRGQRAYEEGDPREITKIYAELEIGALCLDPSQSVVVCDSGQNSRGETCGWRAVAADAALSVYLRVLADKFAAPALRNNGQTA